MQTVRKTQQIGGSEFIRLFCLSHGIPFDNVSAVTIEAVYGKDVIITVQHLGTYRLVELTSKDGSLGNIQVVENDRPKP